MFILTGQYDVIEWNVYKVPNISTCDQVRDWKGHLYSHGSIWCNRIGVGSDTVPSIQLWNSHHKAILGLFALRSSEFWNITDSMIQSLRANWRPSSADSLEESMEWTTELIHLWWKLTNKNPAPSFTRLQMYYVDLSRQGVKRGGFPESSFGGLSVRAQSLKEGNYGSQRP